VLSHHGRGVQGPKSLTPEERLAEVAWLLDYLSYIDSDLSVFHRIDDPEAMTSAAFFAKAELLPAYKGALRARIQYEHEQGEQDFNRDDQKNYEAASVIAEKYRRPQNSQAPASGTNSIMDAMRDPAALARLREMATIHQEG
jgi:hypothetical protein